MILPTGGAARYNVMPCHSSVALCHSFIPTVVDAYTFFHFHIFHSLCISISASGEKENIGVTTVTVSTSASDSMSDALDDIQFKPTAAVTSEVVQPLTPQTLRKPKKASWKLAVDDETLPECLKQQQAAGNQSDTV